MSDKTHRTVIFCLVTSLFFLWGFSFGLLDVMNKNFQNQLHITKELAGLLQLVFYGGYFISAIPASLISTKLGYKGGILSGLGLYALGTILVMVAAQFAAYPLFLGAFFVIACGLGNLETNANPYITKLGDERHAAFRINMAQTFNGFGTFLGPIIGGYAILSLTDTASLASNMQHVQYVYLGLTAVIVALWITFLALKVPETSDTNSSGQPAQSPSYFDVLKVPHFRLGVLAICLYVATQAGLGAYFINFVMERMPGLVDQEAAYFYSIAFICFLLGRIITTPLLRVIPSQRLLASYFLVNALMMIILPFTYGWMTLIVLWITFFCLSIGYPTIFALAVTGIPNAYVKKSASLLVMSTVGGAIMPLCMGLLLVHTGIGPTYLLLLPCFLYITWYALRGSVKRDKIHLS